MPNEFKIQDHFGKQELLPRLTHIVTRSPARFVQVGEDPQRAPHPQDESIKTGFGQIPFVRRKFYGRMGLII